MLVTNLLRVLVRLIQIYVCAPSGFSYEHASGNYFDLRFYGTYRYLSCIMLRYLVKTQLSSLEAFRRDHDGSDITPDNGKSAVWS